MDDDDMPDISPICLVLSVPDCVVLSNSLCLAKAPTKIRVIKGTNNFNFFDLFNQTNTKSKNYVIGSRQSPLVNGLESAVLPSFRKVKLLKPSSKNIP